MTPPLGKPRAAGFQERERAFFDALVERTGDTWWGNAGSAGQYRLERRGGIAASHLGSHARVLELGCGAGAFTLALLQQRPELELEAVDISPVAVAAATRKAAVFPKARFHWADILDLPALGTFDAVVGNGILHHVPVEAALSCVAGCLRPGGKAIFFEPNLLNPHVAFEKIVRPIGALLGNTPDEQAFSRFQIRRALATAGYLGVSVTPIEFLHPKTPPFLLNAALRLSRALEQTPGLKELAGSMLIVAQKPAASPEARPA